ncbi:MAG: CAP domain-containing protein [Massilia sp.]
MSYALRWQLMVPALAAALGLAGCGSSDSDSLSGQVTGGTAVNPDSSVAPDPTGATAPTQTGNIAVDGRNWINYRRSQIKVPQVPENAQINNAALGHAEYLCVNNLMSHDQVAGRQGFTGADLGARLNAAGYTLRADRGYAYGEVIAGSRNGSGFYMAEELITAIYHRFVIFEPMFREIGTGAAIASSGYRYFTADFASRDGYGPGIARGTLVTWPFNGQTQVVPNFFSNTEQPDPVPDANEVGYPISVHTNLDTNVTVTSFSVRPRGGSDLTVLRIAPLCEATVYDVSFAGTVNGAAVTRTWSFTTR